MKIGGLCFFVNRYLFLGILICSVTCSIAQSFGSDSTIEIKEIMVSAARMAQSQHTISMPVQVIQGEKLFAVPSRNLVETLQHEGIWMQKTNHGGGSPFIRGLTGNQVLILKDGIRLNNSIYRYGPNQYLSLQSIFGQKQIDIIKGSGSVQYGSDAIGGVINLISTKPMPGNERLLSGNIFTQWASGGVEKILNASLTASQTNYAISARASFLGYGDLTGGKHTGIQIPSGYHEQNADIKASWRHQTGTWDMSYSMAKQYDVPVYHKVVLEGFNINQSDQLSHHLTYLRNTYEFGRSSYFKQIETTFSYQNLNEQRSIQKKISDPIRLEEDGVSVLGLSSQIEFAPSASMRSVFGFDTYLDQVRSKAVTDNNTANPPVLRGLYPDGAQYLNAGVFNYWDADLQQWNLSWGWRWNYYKLKTTDPNLGIVTLKPSALVWHAAVGRSYGTHRIFLNVDKTFRAPNIDDAGTLGIVDFRYEVPNFDLKPEKGLHLSAGYRWTGSKIHMEHSVYYLQLHDLITRTAVKGDSLQGYPVFIKQNSDKANIYGWESFWNWNINTQWGLEAMVQYTFGQNQSAKEPLRRIPPLFWSGRIQYTPEDHWRFYMESINAGNQNRLSSGDLSDNRISKTGTPSWNILNIGSSFRHSIFFFRAGIENVLNQDYRFHGSGINGAGRLFRLSVQMEW